MPPMIDLRSDTVTRPTPAMRRAMAEAEVGDDVLGDDPTVQRLEEKAARLLGKETGLFVTSGTLGNNLAINVLTRPGDEVLMDTASHSMLFEVGAPSALSGVQTRPFHSQRGIPDVAEIEGFIHEAALHEPGTTLLILENTHNRQGGAIIPLDVMRELYTLAKARGLNIHLDGARLFNAAVASGIPAAEYAAQADSVTFCLSKGLGCPVGSILCGTHDFIAKARRMRKRFGGGMRQVGVLAACGLVALDCMITRLADDHHNARRLAEGIVGLPGITLDLSAVHTNMVYFDTVEPAEDLVHKLESQRILALSTASHRIRLVTHCDVDAEAIEQAIAVFQRICSPLAA